MTINHIETKRHSYSHILAAAVLEMFPEAKLAIGPAIENGFYYDFDLPRTLIPEDLPLLEKAMKQLIKSDSAFERSDVPIKDALAEAKKQKQVYKAELIEDLAAKGEKTVSFYRVDGFVDLCAGPHVESTKELDPKAFKLASIAGAYWRGSEKNKMLQRIYGLAFENEEELTSHLNLIEEAKKRDHRKIGPELDLFMFHDTAPGMPYWLPKGLIVLNELVNFWRVEHAKRGYMEIKSPLINKKELYETSGHWDHYKDEMFLCETEDKEVYGLKPMNCPNAMVVYASKKRSYKELPLRLSDTDTLHRNERSGTLNGLLRVREFSQDDAHIFVTEEQIKSEYQNVFEIVDKFYGKFSLEYTFRLGTRPDNFMGDPKVWDKAEKELKNILDESKKPYIVLEGDGAFYGPKIDILMKDSLGREWQMGTIQLDFQIPRNFKLKYIDADGKEKTPVVLHRVIYGSLERFIGIIIEHYAGALPAWLAPVQVALLPVADRHVKHCELVVKQLTEAGVRTSLDDSKESVGKKIRNAEMQKNPYMLVIGDKEIESGKLSVRSYAEGDLGQKKVAELIKLVQK